MLSITIFGLALAAGLSSAQSTVSLFIPGADPQPLIASVIASAAQVTTYAVQCAPGTEDTECGLPGVIVLTQGPSTAAYTFSQSYEDEDAAPQILSAAIGCSLEASSAVCVATIAGNAANDPGVSTTTISGTDLLYQTATITTSKLAIGAAPASTTGPGTASSTGTTGSTKTSGSSSITTQTSSSGTGPAGAQQTPSTSSTSTGGMAMITGNAWVIGGAALAAALL